MVTARTVNVVQGLLRGTSPQFQFQNKMAIITLCQILHCKPLRAKGFLRSERRCNVCIKASNVNKNYGSWDFDQVISTQIMHII